MWKLLTRPRKPTLSSLGYVLSCSAYATSTTGSRGKLPGKPHSSICSLLCHPLLMALCRTTIHPIINRLGVETLIGRMTRLREDERFRAIVPDSVVLPYPQPPSHLHAGLQKSEPVENEGEIWFDWGFVDFWKSNYCMASITFRSVLAAYITPGIDAVQRGLATDPHQISASSSGTYISDPCDLS